LVDRVREQPDSGSRERPSGCHPEYGVITGGIVDVGGQDLIGTQASHQIEDRVGEILFHQSQAGIGKPEMDDGAGWESEDNAGLRQLGASSHLVGARVSSGWPLSTISRHGDMHRGAGFDAPHDRHGTPECFVIGVRRQHKAGCAADGPGHVGTHCTQRPTDKLRQRELDRLNDRVKGSPGDPPHRWRVYLCIP
jgi:hypothetical protein